MKEFSGIYNIYLKKEYWYIYIYKLQEDGGKYIMRQRYIWESCVRESCGELWGLVVWESCVWESCVYEKIACEGIIYEKVCVRWLVCFFWCDLCDVDWSPLWFWMVSLRKTHMYIFVHTYMHACIHTYISHPRKTYNSNWLDIITRKP